MLVYDANRYRYEVDVEHHPRSGISTATYRGQQIAQREYCRGPLPPWGDSDAEHEAYQARLAEWCEAAEVDLALRCQEHFNADG